jgi:dolichyl-diphosphooligosaccharide--protein glycosyltransferase
LKIYYVNINITLIFQGYIEVWSSRFYSLIDFTYAKSHLPVIASSTDHQPSTWSTYFFDLNFLLLLFPAGIYYSLKQADTSDTHVFIIVYALTALYLSGIFIVIIVIIVIIYQDRSYG